MSDNLYALFDTETTGLLKTDASSVFDQPQIIEIHVVVVDKKFNIIKEFGSLVKNFDPLPGEIIKITGITDDMLKDAPSFPEIYDQLADVFLGVNNMVCHNLSFDRSMLANDLIRIDKLLNFPWPMNHICTVEASTGIKGYRLTLNKLHKEATGEEFSGSHRAKEDVYALVRCFHWLSECKMIDL